MLSISHTHTHTHARLTALFPGLPRWASTRKVQPIWILLKQETVSGSGISWAICKSTPRSRQITMPVPHHSVFLQTGCPSCRPTNSVKALKGSISQSVDFYSGLSGATSARTTCWMMSGYDCLNKKRFITVNGRWTVSLPQRRQLAVGSSCHVVYGPITIAIRARFDYDSSTIQHPTRSYVLSSNNEHVNSFPLP